LGELFLPGEGPEESIPGEEMNEFDSINLAENLKKIKTKYQPTPSFHLKNSIHFNTNPDQVNGTDTYNEILSNSGVGENRSNCQSRNSSDNHAKKEFIIRKSPRYKKNKRIIRTSKKALIYQKVLLKNTLQGTISNHGSHSRSNSKSNSHSNKSSNRINSQLSINKVLSNDMG